MNTDVVGPWISSNSENCLTRTFIVSKSVHFLHFCFGVLSRHVPQNMGLKFLYCGLMLFSDYGFFDGTDVTNSQEVLGLQLGQLPAVHWRNQLVVQN